MQITPVSAQRLQRVKTITETAIHVGRAGLRPALDFLESNGKVVGHALDLTENLSGTDRGIAAGLGAANLLLAATELSQSYHSLCAGDRVRGSLNAAGGTASLVGGTALLWAGATGCAQLGPLALGNLGAASSGVAAVADGLEDVVIARRAGARPVTVGLGAVKMAAGGMLLAGAMTSDPGLQAAASMVFLGAAGGQHLGKLLASPE